MSNPASCTASMIGRPTEANGREARARSLTPLILVGGGRSGTTLIMQLLATSNEVAMVREYPYESKYMSYLLRWALVLDQPYSQEGGWNMSVMLEGIKSPTGNIGSWPWPERDLIRVPEDSASFAERCFRAVWQEFSEVVVRNGAGHCQGEPSPARYFAEKCRPWVATRIGRVLPSRRIYSVRDPRDVWL